MMTYPTDLTMPTANIVAYIYKAKGGSQAEVADILGCDIRTIERIEEGKEKYTKEQIKKIVDFYKVDRLAVGPGHYAGEDVKLLRMWRTRISAGKLKDAEKYHDKYHLEKYDFLPFDLDLSMLYNMFLVKYYVKVDMVDDAKQILSEAEPRVEEANDENQYHYHYNKGIVFLLENEYKEALKHFSLAYKREYVEKKPHAHLIHYNMGLCYSNLGVCMSAIVQYEIAYTLLDREQPYYYAMIISNNLSVNYIKSGNFALAKKYADKTMSLAEKLQSEKHQSRASRNMGCICIEENEFKEALEHLENSLALTEEGGIEFIDTLYYKILSLIYLGHPSAEQEIANIKLMSKYDKHFSILFTSLSHLLTLESDDSIEYIENTTIPYLLERSDHFQIFQYYRFLEKHYTSTDKKIKVWEVQLRYANLYKEMMSLGGEI